jgi:hypothetical protein
LSRFYVSLLIVRFRRYGSDVLVHSFCQGVVLKKLIVSAIAAGIVLAASPAGAIPPPGITLYVDRVSTGCVVDGGKAVLEQQVYWQRGFSTSSGNYVVQQKQGLWKFTVGSGDVERVMNSAGTFRQRCGTGTYETDQSVKVPVKAGRVSGSTFKILWATAKAAGTLKYSVRYRIGSGSYRMWKKGVSIRSANFTARSGKTYFFQARTIKSGDASDWSPDKKFTA